MSPQSLIMLDCLPISLPHLLLLYKDKFIYSLAEKANSKIFQNDFNNILNILKKLYPKQSIVFFEHGSGNAKINGTIEKINAGKSITIAHGHFCIMPKSKTQFFTPILSQAQEILKQNSWGNVETYTIKGKDIFPNFYRIFNIFGYKSSQEYPPYLLLCEYSARNNNSKFALMIQKNANAKTPSQLFRMLIAKYALKDSEANFWNWKTFFTLIKKNNTPEDVQKHIDNIKKTAKSLQQKIQAFNNSAWQV